MRTVECPECHRVATVPDWCERPICVHAWNGSTPEIWDGNDTDGEGRSIEESPNPAYRTPGPKTWTAMVPASVEAVERLARRLNEEFNPDQSWEALIAEENPCVEAIRARAREYVDVARGGSLAEFFREKLLTNQAVKALLQGAGRGKSEPNSVEGRQAARALEAVADEVFPQ